ncbi:DUF6517 family protein [Natrinema salsiterrestre]|uniref:DUF6517 family protein n=1 Tax=Natrinema salsiterrestre TaxID=2950540 RepID=A0A9Q4L3E9_9EURY|nr:DUF6517 family protein [Natrinema salsiterrestre]MDF9745205.1 DUF6517 family protein [Natrinema salsiterrestre]
MKRRTLIAGVGAAGLAGLSGCLGMLGLAEHESSPAGVEAAAREETGYEQTAIEALPIERDVGPTDETVTVTNHMTKHEKSIDMGLLGSRRGAIFNVLTTPQVSIVGRELNPVGEMSTQELMDLVRSNYDGISNISRVEDSDITILEQTTTKTQFTADAEFDGQSVDVDIHITEAVEADEDLLVTIGVYPQYARDQEEPNIETVTEAVTTEVDEDASTGDSGSDDGGNESSDNETDGSSDNETDDNESDDGVLG